MQKGTEVATEVATVERLLRNIDTFDIWLAIPGTLSVDANSKSSRYRLYLGRNLHLNCFLFRKQDASWHDTNPNRMIVGAVEWLLWMFDDRNGEILCTPYGSGASVITFTVDSLVLFHEARCFIAKSKLLSQ